MNIVHVVESLDVGGLEHMVISLATWQKQRGHRVRIVCLFEAGALAPEARAAGLDLVVLDKRPGFDLKAMIKMRAAIAALSADVVHTHNAMSHYYAALPVATSGVRRFINTRHGMAPSRGTARLERLYRAAMLGTHAAVSVCQAGKTRFVEAGIFPTKLAAVVPNGVAIERIEARSDEARRALLAELGRPANAMVVGTVGRLNPVKDHETLLKAISMLRLSGRPVELVIVGDGPMRGSLEALTDSLPLGKSVHFLGMRSDVARLLPAFDIFALSSISEGYSLALVEAAAAALPILATDVGGNADIVKHGTNGLLVPSRHPDQLAAAFATLIDDVDMSRAMGIRGRAWAIEHGSIETMGLAYMNLYASTPATAARRPGVIGASA